MKAEEFNRRRDEIIALTRQSLPQHAFDQISILVRLLHAEVMNDLVCITTAALEEVDAENLIGRRRKDSDVLPIDDDKPIDDESDITLAVEDGGVDGDGVDLNATLDERIFKKERATETVILEASDVAKMTEKK